MKNKKTFLSAFGFAIFLSGLVFLMPSVVKADYASTVSYSCPYWGSTKSGSTCSYNATWSSKDVTFNKYGNFCDSGTLYWANDTPGCGHIMSGYFSSAPFPGSIGVTICDSIEQGEAWLCDGQSTGYAASSDFTNGWYGSFCMPAAEWWPCVGAYRTGDAGVYQAAISSPSCPSGGTPSGSTCSYPATPVYSCPAGGVLSGTTCITDNGCAASTCNTTTCWNNIAWVPGTKDCTVPPNGCQANTCTGLTCWNNVAWVAGTKICTPVINGTCNSIVNNGAYTIAEFNPMKILGDPDGNGTINVADANAALATAVGNPSICTLPTCDLDKNGVTNISDAISILKMSEGLTPSKFCASGLQTNLAGNGPWNWNCLGIGGGSNALNCHANVKTDNGCAVNICAPGSNSSLPTTCDNGINPFTPGTKGPNWADQCISTPVTCTADDCGMSIPSATVSCSRIDSSGCMNPTVCVGTCAAPALQTCPSCPLRIQSWKEVAP